MAYVEQSLEHVGKEALPLPQMLHGLGFRDRTCGYDHGDTTQPYLEVDV